MHALSSVRDIERSGLVHNNPNAPAHHADGAQGRPMTSSVRIHVRAAAPLLFVLDSSGCTPYIWPKARANAFRYIALAYSMHRQTSKRASE